MASLDGRREELTAKAVAIGSNALVGVAGLASIYVAAYMLAVPVVVAAGGLTGVQSTVISTVALGLGLGAVAVATLSITGLGRSFVDLRVPDLREVGYAVAGVVALYGLLVVVSLAMSALGVETAAHGIERTARGNPRVLLVLVPASYLIVGPGEELLFRNVIQKRLYGAFSRPAAIAAASVIFAAVHFQAYLSPDLSATIGSLAVVFLLSLVLGAVYERTENLLVPAFVHGSFNAVQFLLMYVELTGGAG